MRRMGIGLGVGINRSNYAQGIFGAYATRVVADGGVVESGSCVDAVSSLLQSASLLLIPSGYKGGKLYAEIPTNGNGDLTWTRGSDAFRTNASGLIQRVPWNLVQQSETFSNAYWTKSNTTISADTTTAPNGTLTADTLIEDTTNSTHRIFNNSAVTVSNTIATTYSVYLKSAGRTRAWVRDNDLLGALFNLSTGTIVSTDSGVTASITNFGDSWYRCTITKVSSSVSGRIVVYLDNGTSDTYTGNGTSGIYIWGAQLVEGTTAQTYLPTTDRLNFPRLSYMYGSCPAVLLEPQRTNLLVRSNEFSNVGVWVNTNLTVSDNSQSGIDGNTTAALITTTSTFNLLNQQVSVTAGTVYTFSFYVKRGTMTDMKYRVRNVTGASDIIPPTSYYSQTNASTFARISVTITAPAGCTAITFYPFSDTGSIGTAILTQAQVEIGAYATTIIPTTSAQATRIADSFSRNNIYTNGLISASGGTWFVELRGNVSLPRSTSNGGIAINTSSDFILGNGFVIRSVSTGGSQLTIQKVIADTPSTLYTITATTAKIAIKWNGTSCDVFVNGTKEVSASSFAITAMENFNGNGANVTMFIQQMALYPSPLSDTDCTTLTTL